MRTARLLVALAAATAAARAQERIFVDADAPAGGDGTSWAAAFQDLQDGLQAAGAAGGPAEVWVAEGVYTPGPSGDRTRAFEMLSGVAIYGGFAGTESQLGQRDPAANVTTLSGDLLGNDLTGFRNIGDNALQVVRAEGVDETAVLDGFVISGGNANFDPDLLMGGGGLFVRDGSPRVVGCTFEGNSAGENRPNIGGFGGGAYVRSEGSAPARPLFSACVFTENRADSGGAFGVLSQSESAVHNVRFLDCEFTDNAAIHQTGGAVFSASSPFNTETEQALSFERCGFFGNHASYAGAIIEQNTLHFSLLDCVFAGNSADVYAGALWHIHTAQVDVFPASIVGCTFEDNSVPGPGGAILLNSTSADIVNCSFVGNGATGGAGIFSDGYVFGCGREFSVVNSVFSGNTAGVGGGMYIACSPQATIANCTFSANSSAQGAAGIFIDDANAQVSNCVLWGNTTGGSQQESAQFLHAGGGFVAIHYSLVQNLSGGLGGEGNIGGDPLLVDRDGPDDEIGTSDDDVRLGAGSSAIDAADNARVPGDRADLDADGDLAEATPLDLGLGPRFLDDPLVDDTGLAGNGHAQVVDMGAFEAGGGCAPDFNGDGAVNTLDVLAFLNAWNAGDDRADFNGDGTIDTRDVLSFLNAWNAGC
ncbi:MAG TPA: right-handed parallel beta-helix repeat-containing protein [Phycisphaerales bacterium]|nr:right-handed parallel beta-helix repeat-containing protein [Phycisphaerales bacterium]